MMANVSSVRSWDRVRSSVRGAAAPGHTFTVDVFDTLLMRASGPGLVGRIVAERAGAAFGVDPREFAAARSESERVLVSTDRVRGGDGEHRFSDMAAEVSRRLGVPALAEGLLGIEVETESLFLVPNRALADTLRAAARAGAAVVAVSDMYLPASAVRELLSLAGLGDVATRVLTSGDERASKHAGTMYARLKAEGCVAPGRWTHVGDHPSADGTRAAAAGAAAIVCRPPSIAAHRARAERMAARAATDGRSAAALSRHVAAFEDLVNEPDGARCAGRDSLGPVIAAFSVSLERAARTDCLDRLWFLAREGFALKWAYDEATRFSGPSGAATPSAYLLASRASLFPAAATGLGVAEFAASVTNAERHTATTLAKLSGLGRERLDAVARRCGLADADEAFDPLRDPAAWALARDPEVAAAVEANVADRTAAFGAYARASGLSGDSRIGVVDVGWSGQIQGYLSSALSRCGYDPEVVGYYVATAPAAVRRRAMGIRSSGLVFDASEGGWASRSPFLSVPVLEDSCRAPHPSVEAYDADGRAVLRDAASQSRLAEASGDARIAVIQSGFVRAAALAGAVRLVAAPDYVEALRDQARASLAALMRTPSNREAEAFLDVPHVLNFSDDPVIRHGDVEGLRWWRPMKAVARVRAARWKEAVAGRAFGAAGCVAVAVMRAARDRRLAPPPAPRSPAPLSARVPNGRPAPFSIEEAEGRIASASLARSTTPDGRPAARRGEAWLRAVSRAYAIVAREPDVTPRAWREPLSDRRAAKLAAFMTRPAAAAAASAAKSLLKVTGI